MKSPTDHEIDELEQQIQNLKKKVTELYRARPRERVRDYTFATWDGGTVALSSLFGDRRDLILVHNMGSHCSYCTMWADGLMGLLPHLLDRAAFIVTSPESPVLQQRFARGRGWTFPMVSAEGTTFIEDMGFVDKDGYLPGVSTFHKDDQGAIERVARAEFCPGDNFCATWHLFDLLAEGLNGWEPKFSY